MSSSRAPTAEPALQNFDALAVRAMRAWSMDAVEAANSGHPGTPMALAPLGWVIFSRLRRHDPLQPEWRDRDRFVLSCGHASMLQYALLHLCGYPLDMAELQRFRQWQSLTPGHPEYRHTPGVETTTGPLGQGFANAVGMAMAERHLAARFNRPEHAIFDHAVYVIASDGDLMEGVSAEAASLAGHLQLGKLIVFWDDNRITIDGSTDLTFREDVLARFAAYGWHTQSVEDGEDLDAIERSGRAALADARPSLIRLRTVIAHPAPTKRGTSAAHGAPLGAAEVAATKEKMAWPAEPFFVPPEVAQIRALLQQRGAEQHRQWHERWQAYARQWPSEAQALEEIRQGALPAGLAEALPQFAADASGMATRQASGKVLQAIAQQMPSWVGGSADLAGSNLTTMQGYADFTAPLAGIKPSAELPPVPRNVHWGVREHAMGAALNGMALHGGVTPFGATFLIFSDYMRPAIRLAALMNLPVRYVFTHDSIGVGEDGPTHQPIEQLAGLRSIPGMTVLRPADANEVRECWLAALRCSGPAALALTRQKLPVLDRRRYASAEGVARGAYVLTMAEDEPQAVLVATGSEVHLALAAHEALQRQGVRSRVVSMPSWELFAAQDLAYQRSVLWPEKAAHVVIEAATRFGWERWVGNRAAFITLDHFGASAPAEVLFEQFGFTVERVVDAVRELLAQR